MGPALSHLHPLRCMRRGVTRSRPRWCLLELSGLVKRAAVLAAWPKSSPRPSAPHDFDFFDGDGAVVIGVLHGSRHPRRWKNRL